MSILITDVKCNQNECLGLGLTLKDFNKDVKMLCVSQLKNCLSHQFKAFRLSCYVSSLTLLLQYAISLSQKKPGLKEDNKEIRYSQCSFIHLKSLHDLQRRQITVCHFLYAINGWLGFFFLVVLFCFVLSVVRNFCFVLSFVVVVIVPGSSAYILSCSRPYVSLHSNQHGFYCLYIIVYIFAI